MFTQASGGWQEEALLLPRGPRSLCSLALCPDNLGLTAPCFSPRSKYPHSLYFCDFPQLTMKQACWDGRENQIKNHPNVQDMAAPKPQGRLGPALL